MENIRRPRHGTRSVSEGHGIERKVSRMNEPLNFINTYLDTRGVSSEPFTFTQAIIKGIAKGGGLFVPRILPRLTLDEIAAFSKISYAACAATIYRRFGVDLSSQVIDTLMKEAYGANFDTPEVAPVQQITSDTFVLELWHGPTSAFKDMALQCLPGFFGAAIEQARAQSNEKRLIAAETQGVIAENDFLILVATSGDTGKAALEGFKDHPHSNVIVFYPHGGISDIQLRQMTTQLGDNVGVFGVDGNFDDCQASVKSAFSDAAFTETLAAEHHLCLSSANSINWGRLLPQIVYYVNAYAQLIDRGALAAGDELDVCVPTGNFGNILAAFYAKEIGVPLGRLYCASNENRVLTDFISTGVYDISERQFMLTPSPSMDILISSNLERQLFEFTGRDAKRIRTWTNDLREKRRFQVDRDTFALLRENFCADWVSNDESLKTIREVFETYRYLLDPHTAVAWKVAERLRETNPVLVVATAHWAKFGADVYRALNSMAAHAPLPAGIAKLSGPALNKLLSGEYGAGAVPFALAALDKLPIRFSRVCIGSKEGIELAVFDWLHGQRCS
jgi:threonine synthase